MTELAKADRFELDPGNYLLDVDYTGEDIPARTEPTPEIDTEAPTIRLPLSPFYAFGHYRRRVRERFARFQQKIYDDFVTELAALDTYLDSLGITGNATPCPDRPAKRRWRR